MIQCAWCGEEVNTRKSGVLRRIVGWEETRSSGGANKIMFRQELGIWAHKTCVEHHGGDLALSHEVPTLFNEPFATD